MFSLDILKLIVSSMDSTLLKSVPCSNILSMLLGFLLIESNSFTDLSLIVTNPDSVGSPLSLFNLLFNSIDLFTPLCPYVTEDKLFKFKLLSVPMENPTPENVIMWDDNLLPLLFV